MEGGRNGRKERLEERKEGREGSRKLMSEGGWEGGGRTDRPTDIDHGCRKPGDERSRVAAASSVIIVIIIH